MRELTASELEEISGADAGSDFVGAVATVVVIGAALAVVSPVAFGIFGSMAVNYAMGYALNCMFS